MKAETVSNANEIPEKPTPPSKYSQVLEMVYKLSDRRLGCNMRYIYSATNPNSFHKHPLQNVLSYPSDQ